jgi:hypothetical protein
MKIRDIRVWGTVHEGQVLPVKKPADAQVIQSQNFRGDQELSRTLAMNAAQLAAIQRGSGALAVFLDPSNPNSAGTEGKDRLCTCGSRLIHILFFSLNPSVTLIDNKLR